MGFSFSDAVHPGPSGVVVFEPKNVEEDQMSEFVKIGSFSWRLKISRSVNFLKGFVNCNPLIGNTLWPCHAHYQVTLKSHNGDDYTKRAADTFQEPHGGWGWQSFLLLEDLVDPNKGYMINDRFTIHA